MESQPTGRTGDAPGLPDSIYRDLLKQASDGIHVLDANGYLVAASNRFHEMLGYGKDELLGCHVSSWDASPLSPEELTDRVRQHLEGGHSVSFDTWHRRRDGTPIEVGITLSVVHSADRQLLFATSREILERQVLERSLQHCRAFNLLIGQINHAIARSQDESWLLQRICELTTEETSVKLIWIGTPDAAGWIRIQASAGQDAASLDGLSISVDASRPEGQGPAARVWRDGNPHFPVDSDHDQTVHLLQDRSAANNLHSCAVLPLRRRGATWGLVALYGAEPELFRGDTRAAVEELAGHVSAALDQLDLTRREREQNRLRQLLLDGLQVGIAVFRYPGNTLEHANTQLLRLAGAGSLEELQAHGGRDFHPDEESYRAMRNLRKEVLRNGRASLRDVRYRSLDGCRLWVDVFGFRLDEGDGVQRIIWTHVDVTERHDNEAAIEALNAMREALLDNTVVGMVLVRYPDRVVIDANQGFLDMMGYSEQPDRVIGQPVDGFYTSIEQKKRMGALARQIFDKGRGNLSNLQGKRADGSIVYCDMHGRYLEGSGSEQPIIVWTSVDVTERRALAQELNRQALFDPLTGLPNRRAFTQHVNHAVARARRHSRTLAVGIIDLDDFKPVNDSFGHLAGDLLLKEFAQRLRGIARESDFVARIGGDEFVAVMEDLEGATGSPPHLDAVWRRLHRAVEQPFELGDGHVASVGMSMGVALYPADGEDADALLRQADAAMYEVKGHKVDRRHWWKLGTTESVGKPTESPFNAFGAQERQLLSRLTSQLHQAIRRFPEEFYSIVNEDADVRRVLCNLSGMEIDRLKESQGEHVAFLFAPDTEASDIQSRARELGRIHALSGVSAAGLADSATVYGELLNRTVDRAETTVLGRYRAMRILATRLWLDITTQISAIQVVMDAYNAHTARPLPGRSSWPSLAQQELDAIATLPGLKACEVFLPHAQGVFAVDLSAGPAAEQLVEIFNRREQTSLPVPHEQQLIDAAWQTGEIQRSDTYLNELPDSPWLAQLEPSGVRSMAALPVRLSAGSGFVLAIQGGFVNQFASPWMQTFLASLRERWHRIGLLSRQQAVPVRQERAHHFRQLLREGGLRMHMQPIIDLRTGNVVKVEALARLQDGDRLVWPDEFLPAFNDSDLNTLFRLGLGESLARLAAWLGEGLDIHLSLNVAPSTLAHPDCSGWVNAALQEHGVCPGRLTLELLETQEYDELRHDWAIGALHDLGVRLAIDDLGAGYSSLKRLTSLPFDTIKVDQSLMRDVASDPIKVLRLLRIIVLIGLDFERDVIVEGVENLGIAEAATLLGARYGQGLGLAPSMPPEEIGGWITGNRGPQPAATAPVRTFLGALAYHWAFVNSPQAGGTTNVPECPLYHLLPDQGRRPPEVEAWHRMAHQGRTCGEREAAEQRLRDWLVDQVMQESGATD